MSENTKHRFIVTTDASDWSEAQTLARLIRHLDDMRGIRVEEVTDDELS